MYAFCRDIHPPTGVDQCITSHFFRSDEEVLVVSSTSLLRFFEVENDTESQKKPKLVQLAQYRLHANIQSMDRVLLPGAERDTLLLAFSDAKLSFVEYDPELNNIKTVSMHQFEEDNIREGVVNNRSRPLVRVDPGGRCAVLLSFGTHLAVIPFLQRSLLEDDPFTIKGDIQSILPSYTVSLSSLTEPVGHVKDMCFLEGYNNPMLLVLCEPIPTWAGRISLRTDSYCVLGLSLNTVNKDHTIIWRVLHLPFDVTKLLPVPKPLSGVLVFGANSLIYLNQSSPPYGLSLNSVSELSSRFPLRPSNLSIVMDCCNPAFINKEELVVCLRNGDLYRVALVPDSGMRGIRSFSIDKLASTVLSSCVASFGSRYVFVGSRLGNSMLLRYTNQGELVKQVSLTATQVRGSESEDMDLYNVDQPLPVTSSSAVYKFEVCDSLVCIGPVVDSCVGESMNISEEFSQKSDLNLELVLCSGHGKSGSLSIVQRGVRPQIVTTFELPGCTDMWTVYSGDGDEHGFLILSRRDSTMVLQTSQEITEVDNSGFATQSATIFTGNLGRYILQSTSTDVRLLEGVTQHSFIPLDMRSGVKSCDTCGPYCVILLNEGNVGLLQVKGDKTPLLDLTWAHIHSGSKVTCISAYTDYSGLFESSKPGNEGAGPGNEGEGPPLRKKLHLLSSEEVDELLYSQTTEDAGNEKVGVTHWLVLTRDNGALEIYELPSFDLLFAARNFTSCPSVLYDSGATQNEGGVSSDVAVDDLLAVGMGPNRTRPFIMAIVNRELLIYESYCYQTDSERTNLRFSRVSHDVLLSDRKEQKLVKQYPQNAGVIRSPPKLKPFNNIGGYSGVFVSGLYPHWVIMSQRQSLHVHSMYIDGPVTCFAPFNNVNCQRGFLYFNIQSELRISQLPNHLLYDSYWPVRRVQLHATPHFIEYHSETKTHVLVSSVSKPVSMVPQLGPDDADILEPMERDERFVVGEDQEFRLQLYSPVSWEAVPSAIVTMDMYHHVTSMKVMSLRSQETLSGRKEFIVVSSMVPHGEDFSAKGNVQIFDIAEVIPEPGKPLTKYRLKSLYSQEQKWPVTGLECVDGLILTTMGQKIFMWQFKDKKDLLAVAFIDAETYIHSAKSLRGLILTSDISRGIQLLQYQESRRSLALISEDLFPMEVFKSDFLVDGNQLGFVASDSDENIVLLQYQPENPDSNGGAFLTRQGDFNVGSVINTFIRIRCKSSAGLTASTEIKIALMDKRHCLFYGTLDGGLGYVITVPEKVYRRLSMLQIKLTQGVRHVAGLNPKCHRSYKSSKNILYSPQRNILDGNLVWSYLNLSSKEKSDFARQIGTTPAQIMEDLKEIEKVTSHF